MRTARVSRADVREITELSRHARSAFAAGVRVAKREALASPALALAARACSCSSSASAGRASCPKGLTIGELVAFLMYLTFLVLPVILVLQSGHLGAEEDRRAELPGRGAATAREQQSIKRPADVPAHHGCRSSNSPTSTSPMPAPTRGCCGG